MSKVSLDAQAFLEKINDIQRELELLKRDLIKNMKPSVPKKKVVSLYGAVKGEDITEAMIEKAKKALFRDLENL